MSVKRERVRVRVRVRVREIVRKKDILTEFSELKVPCCAVMNGINQ